MTNAIYPRFKQVCLDTGGGLVAGNVRVALVSAGYTYSATHEFYSGVPSTAVVATSPALTSKTITNGVFDAADVTISAVSGAQVTALIIYIDTGTATTSRLVAFLDNVTNLPFTPNGGDVTITWDNGANRIFAL